MKDRAVYSLTREVVFTAIHAVRWDLRQQLRSRYIYTGAERKPFNDRVRKLIAALRAFDAYLYGKSMTSARRSSMRGYTKAMRRFVRKLRAERREKDKASTC